MEGSRLLISEATVYHSSYPHWVAVAILILRLWCQCVSVLDLGGISKITPWKIFGAHNYRALVDAWDSELDRHVFAQGESSSSLFYRGQVDLVTSSAELLWKRKYRKLTYNDSERFLQNSQVWIQPKSLSHLLGPLSELPQTPRFLQLINTTHGKRLGFFFFFELTHSIGTTCCSFNCWFTLWEDGKGRDLRMMVGVNLVEQLALCTWTIRIWRHRSSPACVANSPHDLEQSIKPL